MSANSINSSDPLIPKPVAFRSPSRFYAGLTFGLGATTVLLAANQVFPKVEVPSWATLIPSGLSVLWGLKGFWDSRTVHHLNNTDIESHPQPNAETALLKDRVKALTVQVAGLQAASRELEATPNRTLEQKLESETKDAMDRLDDILSTFPAVDNEPEPDGTESISIGLLVKKLRQLEKRVENHMEADNKFIADFAAAGVIEHPGSPHKAGAFTPALLTPDQQRDLTASAQKWAKTSLSRGCSPVTSPAARSAPSTREVPGSPSQPLLPPQG